MICKFCGQNNSDDAAFCSRCGSPLKENRNPKPAVSSASSSESDLDDDKKTMRMKSQPDEANVGNGVMVHDCGYPLLPGMQVCPKCRRPVVFEPAPTIPDEDEKRTKVISAPDKQPQHQDSKATERMAVGVSSAKKTERFLAPDRQDGIHKSTEPSVVPEQPSAPQSAKKTERFVPSAYEGDGVNKKTVNIHQMQKHVAREAEPEAIPHCSLKPIAREGETMAKPQKRDFIADRIVLNRDNTDPGNYSITSQQQALLTFENGKWYIEDCSAYKTTFIRVTRRTELHEGDVVGMGDREFEFSTK